MKVNATPASLLCKFLSDKEVLMWLANAPDSVAHGLHARVLFKQIKQGRKETDLSTMGSLIEEIKREAKKQPRVVTMQIAKTLSIQELRKGYSARRLRAFDAVEMAGSVQAGYIIDVPKSERKNLSPEQIVKKLSNFRRAESRYRASVKEISGGTVSDTVSKTTSL